MNFNLSDSDLEKNEEFQEIKSEIDDSS